MLVWVQDAAPHSQSYSMRYTGRTAPQYATHPRNGKAGRGGITSLKHYHTIKYLPLRL